jgi:hypothetical protein
MLGPASVRLRETWAKAALLDLLGPEERAFFSALPRSSPFGGCEAGRERGLFWSADWQTATKFAFGVRCRNSAPTLVQVATCGRIVLAKFCHLLVRQRLLSEQTRQNVDAIRIGIENRPVMTFGAFFGYSVSLLPSNYLFIAYGLTSLPIVFVALPFLLDVWLAMASGSRLHP